MRKRTAAEFQEKLNEIYGDRYIVVGEYINNETKVAIKCNVCGKIFYKRPSKIICADREGCYFCSGRDHYKTRESLQKELDDKFPGEYDVVGEYVKARQPLLVKRVECGHTYMISPDNLLRGKGCPRCSIRQSRYMDEVEKILSDMNIEYEKEKRFDECKSIRCLPFDYYIPSKNTCIEVDGEFHYRINYKNKSSWDSEQAYLSIKDRDAKKTKFCEDNGIDLIRLPYYEYENFRTLLQNKLYANTETTAELTS